MKESNSYDHLLRLMLTLLNIKNISLISEVKLIHTYQ